MQEVDDFKEFVQGVQKKKGRMDAASRAKATELVVAILSDPEQQLRTVLPLCEDLQSDVVANAIGIAWPRLTVERQLEITGWLPPPRTERAQRRIALVASRLAETDGSTALRLLDKLIPDHRPNKELRELLIAALLSNGYVVPFDHLRDKSAPEISLRIFKALSALSFDPASAVEPMVRYKLSIAVLKFLVDHDLERTAPGADLISKVVVEVERWPQGLREQFATWLKTGAPTLSEEFFPLKPTAPVTQIQPQPKDARQVSDNTLSIEQYLDQRARALAAESQALSQIRALLSASGAESERQLAVWRAKEIELNEQIQKLNSTRISLQNELALTARRSAELQAALERAEHEGSSDREKLTQQIAANANGRVAEFKKQVALTLARQMIDLPNRDVKVDAELGRVLLLQFHQLIQVLEELGIEFNAMRGVPK